MSEKLPEPYGWLYYGTPDRPLFRRDHPEGLYWLCVSSAPVYSHEQMRVAVAEAGALRRERDELAARLAEIERATDLDADIIEAQRAVVQQLASRPVCNWAGQCKHQRQATADAPELAEPADPRTPPPGCRLLGDYEPAQSGDMAYIGAIGGRWRRVRPRMGIIGATMDELSDGARVLALARPCRCPRGER